MKWVIATLMGFALSSPALGDTRRGSVETIDITTSNVERGVRVRLWLPPHFDSAASGSVPLLVFLHDGWGSDRSFFRRGLDDVLQEQIAAGETPAPVVACPLTKGTFNSDDLAGERRVFSFLADDLVDRLLERYPQLRRDPAGRALTGISMGGYGALKVTLRRPALFGSVSAVSTWVEDLSFEYQQQQGWFVRHHMGRVFGKDRETNIARQESLFTILAESPPSSQPPLLLITGEDDRWVTNGNHPRLERALSEAGITFDSRTRPGVHDWDFWRSVYGEVLAFHGERLSGDPGG